MAEKAVRQYLESGAKDPSTIRVKNVVVHGRSKMYTSLFDFAYGWVISFEFSGKNGFSGYVKFNFKTVLLCDDGKVRSL
jgi:hypothetical protein